MRHQILVSTEISLINFGLVCNCILCGVAGKCQVSVFFHEVFIFGWLLKKQTNWRIMAENPSLYLLHRIPTRLGQNR